MVADTHSRSLLKAVTYRVFGSATTAGLVFFYSSNARVSLGIGLADMVSKAVLYYMHERVWHYIPFGRTKAQPEYEI